MTDQKELILHSLGTLCALGMVIDTRVAAYGNPTPELIMAVVKKSIKEMEIAYHKQISS